MVCMKIQRYKYVFQSCLSQIFAQAQNTSSQQQVTLSSHLQKDCNLNYIW